MKGLGRTYLRKRALQTGQLSALQGEIVRERVRDRHRTLIELLVRGHGARVVLHAGLVCTALLLPQSLLLQAHLVVGHHEVGA